MKSNLQLCSSKRCPNGQNAFGRRGSVILVVLVVVVMLSFSAYVFAELMLVEAQATAIYGRKEQARSFAESGIEYAAAQLADSATDRQPDSFHNRDLFGSVIVQEAAHATERGRFSIVAPPAQLHKSTNVRFGLVDESSKLNLNSLPLDKRKQRQARRMLMGLPGMTLQMADAILDFIDEDEELREFGAESSYYTTLSPAYTSKNAPLQSIDELLLVRGVTSKFLYGEDTNNNGWLDANEDDERSSPPNDDGDGFLRRGWNASLTVNSRESNLRSDGRRKINVNQRSLVTLYDELESKLGERVAQFVVAYRLNGSLERQQELIEEIKKRREGGFDVDGLTAEDLEAEAMERAAIQRGSAATGRSDGNSTDRRVPSADDAERGGLSLTAAKTERIRSLIDLFGASVRITINGVDSVLDSPWTGDPGSIQSELPNLIDRLTTTDSNTISGRINVNQARFEVLVGIPGITEELANSIVATQRSAQRNNSAKKNNGRHTVAWLLYEGLVDLKSLRRIAPYLTTHGDVYRIYSMGYFDRGAPTAFVEAIVDASEMSPRIISFRELPAVNSIEFVVRKHNFDRTRPATARQ